MVTQRRTTMSTPMTAVGRSGVYLKIIISMENRRWLSSRLWTSHGIRAKYQRHVSRKTLDSEYKGTEKRGTVQIPRKVKLLIY